MGCLGVECLDSGGDTINVNNGTLRMQVVGTSTVKQAYILCIHIIVAHVDWFDFVGESTVLQVFLKIL